MDSLSASLFAFLLAALWCGFGLYGLARMAARSPQVRELLERLRRSGPLGEAAALALLVTVVAIGGTKPGGGNQPRNTPNTRNDLPSAPSACSVVEEPAFGLVEVRTSGVSLRAEPTNSVEAAAWRLRGASEDGIWIEREEPFFALGTNPVRRVYASASGALSFENARHPPVGATLPDSAARSESSPHLETALPQRLGGDASPHLKTALSQRLGGDASPHLEAALAPFRAPLGILPSANETNAAPSRFWHAPAPGGGLLVAWENVLVDRLPGRRATVQAELRPNGDFTYRYNFTDALDPPSTNFVIGAQAGTNAVNALYFGPLPEGAPGGAGWGSLSAPVWRVDGGASPPGEPQSVADLLCTNGALRTPARFALEWRNVAEIGDGDSDGDGLSDWDEVFRHGTDPHRVDTDGDGLSDSAEVLSGSDPLDADENNDGVPDGADPAAWAADPLWAANAPSGCTIAISLNHPLSSPTTLVIGSLSIPLRENGCWTLSLEKGALYPFRLFSGGEGVRLSICPAGGAPSLRSPDMPPLRSGADDEDDGFWLDDPTDAFGSGSTGGEGRMAFPAIVLSPAQGEYEKGNHLVGDGEMCVHSQDGIARWEWSLSPDSGDDPQDRVSVEDLLLVGHVLALPIPAGEDSADGTISVSNLKWGGVSKHVSAHRFRVSQNGSYCEGCSHYVPNDVSVSASTDTLVLKHDNSLRLTASCSEPSGVSFSNHRFEIRRKGTSQWYPLGTGRTLDWTARIAGTFEIRGLIDVDGSTCESSVEEIEVQFPMWSQIATDGTIASAMQSAWAQTLADCTETPVNQAREWAFWILLDTRTGAYSTTTPVHGPWAPFGNGGEVDPGSPPTDDPEHPSPVSTGATYCVAGFHTHMPICYDPNLSAWRTVGPSTGISGDYATAQSIHIPGLLWDYEPNDLSTGHLTRNHSINGPSRLYPVIPPVRRQTP